MQPIAAGDFTDIVAVDDPDVHPENDRVAFIRRVPEDDTEYASTVYQADLTKASVRRLTVEEGSDQQPRWGPDGEHLAFVSDRLTDDDRPQLWLLPTAGGEAQQVTNVPGGVSSIEWSPSGEQILFSQRVEHDDIDADRDLDVPEEYEPEEPDPRVIDRTVYRANEHFFDRRREQVYTLDVGEESVHRVSEWDELDHQFATWGDDRTVYYLSKLGEDPDDSLEYELVSVDVETGDRERVDEIEGFVTGLDATTDGRVVFAYSPTPRPTIQQPQLIEIDPDTGKWTNLTEGLNRAVFGQIEIGPDEEFVYFHTPDTGGNLIRRVPLSGGEIEVLTDDAGTSGAFSVGQDHLAYVKSEWDHPGDLFARSLSETHHRRLTSVNDDLLDERVVGRPEVLWFESSAGHEIQGWLLTPPDEADVEEPYPLVLEIHGGPHSMWTTSGTVWHEFQSLSGAGYAVLWTNPRGSLGYGEDFASAIERDWGDVTYDDLMTALDTVIERPEIDESQLFVTGGSFGGYQTTWTIGRTDRFEAAVSQRGVYDFAAFYGTTDVYQLIESEFDATPWEDHAYLYEHSPTSLVEGVATPTLLIHSEEDYRTPIATAEMYYRALRKLEVPTRLVRYPREGHELSRSGEPAHRIDRIERIIRWFDGYADHTDVPPALERKPNEGLSIAESDEDETNEDDQ